MNSFVLLPLFVAATLAGVLPGYGGYGGYAGYDAGYAHPAPAYHHVAVAPAVVHKAYAERAQYHSQDAYGQYAYGYAEPNGAKKEVRHKDHTVTGSYTHPLPDGRVLTNTYVADEYGFRSSLAPTAAKDFAPVVKAAYNVAAPVVEHAVNTYVHPQPAVHVSKAINYAAPAIGYGHHAPLHYGGPAYH